MSNARLKFKSLEEANKFSEEVDGPVFEDLEAVSLYEFHSKALADRIERRKKLKDHAKSRKSKIQHASAFSRDSLSRSLKKFNQTNAGKRLRQRIQQLRKDGRYDKFETLQTLNSLNGAILQEARYSRSLVEEVHTELCVERMFGLLAPLIEGLMTDKISNAQMVILMNRSELAESINIMLGIEEDTLDLVQALMIDTDDDQLVGIDPIPDPENPEGEPVIQEPEVKSHDTIVQMFQDVGESVQNGELFENIDTNHGQVSHRTFTNTPATESEKRKGVLSIVKGPALFLNSISRNRRFYSADVWLQAVNDPDFQDRLNRRVMMGSVGHDVELTEEAIRTGMVSHIVSDLVIDQDAGVGYATYEILDSKSGRELQVQLDAGIGLKTSTRAFGTLSNERLAGLPAGVDIIAKKGFQLIGIDFVIDPGFLGSEAIPS